MGQFLQLYQYVGLCTEIRLFVFNVRHSTDSIHKVILARPRARTTSPPLPHAVLDVVVDDKVQLLVREEVVFG